MYIILLYFVVSLLWRGVSRCVCFNPTVSDIDRGINLLSPSVSDTVKGEEGGDISLDGLGEGGARVGVWGGGGASKGGVREGEQAGDEERRALEVYVGVWVLSTDKCGGGGGG